MYDLSVDRKKNTKKENITVVKYSDENLVKVACGGYLYILLISTNSYIISVITY